MVIFYSYVSLPEGMFGTIVQYRISSGDMWGHVGTMGMSTQQFFWTFWKRTYWETLGWSWHGFVWKYGIYSPFTDFTGLMFIEEHVLYKPSAGMGYLILRQAHMVKQSVAGVNFVLTCLKGKPNNYKLFSDWFCICSDDIGMIQMNLCSLGTHTTLYNVALVQIGLGFNSDNTIHLLCFLESKHLNDFTTQFWSPCLEVEFEDNLLAEHLEIQCISLWKIYFLSGI